MSYKEFIGSVRRGAALGSLFCVLDSSSSKETVRVRKRTQGSALSRRPIIPLDGRKEFIGSLRRGAAQLVLDSSSSKETVRVRTRTQGSALSRLPIIPLDGRKEFIGSVRRGLATSLPIGALRRNGPWKLVLDSSSSKETVRVRKRQFEFERDSSNSKEDPRVGPF